MSYINNILKIVILFFGVVGWSAVSLQAQTCCSGGVPLSGNIGFEGADKGAFQLEVSYDLNYLATLKNGSDVYADESRRRITQSVLLKTGYSFNSWLAFDALFSYVGQSRSVTFQGETNHSNTSGIGDAVYITNLVIPFRCIWALVTSSLLATGLSQPHYQFDTAKLWPM